MSNKIIAPYGSWDSPITADLLVGGTISLGQLVVDGDAVYWTEGRPTEGGRYVIVKWTEADGRVDLTPTPFNARTRVHEYGGGSYTVHDGTVIFASFADQRLYRQEPGGTSKPVTPDLSAGALRFADGVVDGRNGRLLCIREDHRQAPAEAQNSLVSLRLDGRDDGTILAGGNDFYSSPALSPNGQQLAWLTWNHPNMPWDGTELWLADLSLDVEGNHTLSNARQIAGGKEESIFQPRWSPDGILYYISDRSNWWNLYRWDGDKGKPVYPMVAEFGQPQWVFGQSTYDFADANTLICWYTQNGSSTIARLDLTSHQLTPFDIPYVGSNIHIANGKLIYLGSSATAAAAIVCHDLATGDQTLLAQASKLTIDPGYIAVAQPIEFPTADGLTAHAYFYPPTNKDYAAPDDEKPPLLVLSHGGPTSATNAGLSLSIQYWTSRGIGVVDVNYGGSTGYGRDYRQRLNGTWGVVDVVDCANAARYLVAQGLADGNRLAIRGGSAGGYTTLCALTFHDLFSAGASHFGISDMEAMALETHKFESRYLDSLIGAYPAEKEKYRQRSPIHYIDQLSCPLILFQGLEDKVVPPNQAEMMFAALQAKGIPVAYLPFEGEQHGFRRAENIKRSLEAELYFYGKVFGFELAAPVEPVEIVNL
ncbi:MAG: S9 family peptidase [Anaerolineales bacterium]|nr:S9 family peptidase [Anaerolineales bacterium]